MRLEELAPDAAIRGVLPDAVVTVVAVDWHGSEALTLTYRTPEGRRAEELLFRGDEARLEVLECGRPWSFDGDRTRSAFGNRKHSAYGSSRAN